jgi:hypothetical protein
MEYKLKDSGERQVFNTGAQRDVQQVEKGRYDLVSPIAIKRISIILAKGAKKYSERNWERGMPISRYIDSALRHLYQYVEGKRDEDHLGQAMWNLHSALHGEESIQRHLWPKELYDLPCYINEKDMDESTKSWWENMKKITQPKSKTVKSPK